jgi:DNA polymerase III subunit delta
VLVRPGDLGGHLAGDLAPVYLISGDDPLLVQEACDQVLEAARGRGFDERSVLHADGAFNWNDLLQDAASLSLFSARRLIDLRVQGGKLDKDASDALRSYAANPSPDNLLLIRCDRLSGDDVKKAWFKALDRVGAIVRIWPIDARELPRWLGARLRRAGVALTPDAVELLALRVEGNLAAAVQAIERLRVAGLAQPIDAEALQAELEDAAHFDAFELVDAVFAGDAARASRVLRSLDEEGVSLFAVVGAFTSQLRILADGRPLFGARRQSAPGFLRRIGGVDGIDRVLAECALIDAQAKGQIPGDAWRSLEDLYLRLCGTRVLPGTSVLAELRRSDS